MKKNILILAFLLLSIFSFGQSATDYFVPSANMLDLTKFTNNNQTIVLAQSRYVINVQFHAVRCYNIFNQITYNADEYMAFNIIAKLNEAYNQHNIFFKYRGFNSVFNSTNNLVNDQNIVFLKQKFVTENLYNDNAINIFFIGFGGSRPVQIKGQDNTDIYVNSTVTIYDFWSKLIPQMVGHCLGLFKIEGDLIGFNYNNNNVPCMLGYNYIKHKPLFQGSFYGIENVTRLLTSPQFNAYSAGDRVADTRACFTSFQNNFCRTPGIQNQPYINYSTWFFDSSIVDPTGNPYICTADEALNYMSDYDVAPGYVGRFTAGQVKRMKEYIQANMDDIFRKKLNVLEDDAPDVSVLYEPFSGKEINNNNNQPVIAYSKTSTLNNTFTGYNIWNCGPFNLRFQTGFNCEFSDATSGATNNQTIYQQFNSTGVPCLNLKIPILGNEVYTICEPICFSTFEPFTSGTLTSTSNIGSSNYTTEELDKIKASDPKLYEELQSGKYHIITKSTDSGATEQKVIFKN